MEDLHVAPQLELARREPETGLLGQLAVRRLLEALSLLDVPAGQTPAVRVDRRLVVALLQQHSAATVDEQDAGEVDHPATLVPALEVHWRWSEV